MAGADFDAFAAAGAARFVDDGHGDATGERQEADSAGKAGIAARLAHDAGLLEASFADAGQGFLRPCRTAEQEIAAGMGHQAVGGPMNIW